jgi:stage II sporulation protein D
MGRIALTVWLVLALVLILLFVTTVHAPQEQTPAAAATLRVLHGNELMLLPPEEYLVGVVAAEMPADFEPEALKAQAVAARTYALYCAATGKHPDADVCTASRCCQAWRSEAQLRESWGADYGEKIRRIRRAVESTAGEVLRFQGEAIFAAFHSSSAGFTEDCGAIWSGLPYLVSVSSPESADTVPNYVSRVELRPLDFRDTLLYAEPEADLTGDPASWLGELHRDDSGRVAEAVIGGAVFSGVRLRELFSLRSTAFTLEYDGDFRFTVTGFGHGVGMSQYGAEVMAEEGADYREILAHYYPGTELVCV